MHFGTLYSQFPWAGIVAATEIGIKMIEKLLQDTGTAEMFPYNCVEEIKEKFGIDYHYEI